MNGCQASVSRPARALTEDVPSTREHVLVRDVMLRYPKTLPAQASVEEARAVLTDDHVHMVLLIEGGALVGTMVRADLPRAAEGGSAALPWSALHGRTVLPDAGAGAVQELMIARAIRRVAVVDHEGTLLGLICLKRRRTGFCSDDDVVSRSQSRRAAD
jgi:CBS domain-containing protein